jgi:hypothetical protein
LVVLLDLWRFDRGFFKTLRPALASTATPAEVPIAALSFRENPFSASRE